MTGLLLRLLSRGGKTASRESYGTLSGAVGVALNLLLFAFKFIAGTLSGSIAVTADAFNNLSDAGSSVITIAGFRMAGMPPDSEHPFGHGRIEYVSGLMVSMAIMLVGAELARSSVGRIIEPVQPEFGTLALVILGVSVIAKLWMAWFNRKLGRMIESEAIMAVSADSFSDAAATLLVTMSALAGSYFGVNADGWVGLIVAALIIYAGFRAAGRSLSPLLGKAPDPVFVQAVTETVLAHEAVTGMHDLIIHDYGPGRRMISLHAEMPCGTDVLLMHDVIDSIELELRGKFGCEATIHMDPVEVGNELADELYSKVRELVCSIDSRVSIHDFRIVRGNTHTNLVFDVVAPHRFHISDAALADMIREGVRAMEGNYFAVIRVEKSFSPAE